jgi:P27 family predicted phage terminase small subunit
MAGKGPPPKPTKLRLLQGNPSREPINTKEPQPEAIAADIPPPMELGEQAALIWAFMCSTLSSIGLLTVCDLRILARYCDLCVRWYQAKLFLDEHGETYEVLENVRVYDKEKKVWDTVEKRKGFANYPQVKNYFAYCKELIRIEQEMGLTPAARSRIQIEIFKTGGAQDALAQYLAGNNRKPLAG